MSITTEITRVQNLKAAIRTKLVALGLVTATANLEVCKDAIEGIVNRGSPDVSLDTSTPSVNIAVGYYGGGTVSITPEQKTLTENGVYTPTSGKVLSQVTVDVPAPAGYADVTGVTSLPGDVLATKLYVNAEGELTAGTMPDNGTVAATIDGLTTTSYTIPAGKHSGSGTVSLTDDIEQALAAI